MFKFGRSWDSLNLKILEIRLPRPEGESKDLIREINLSEQLFSALSSIDTPFVFEVAVKNAGQGIGFFLAIPRRRADFAKETIQGLFLEARVEEVSDYTIFQPHGVAVAGFLGSATSDLLPSSTYRETQTDSFAPILSTLSRIRAEDEGAAIQLVVRPADQKIKDHLAWALDQLKQGVKFSQVKNAGRLSWSDVSGLFAAASKSNKTETTKPELDEEVIRAIETKTVKPLFAVNARIVTSSTDQNRAEDLFLALAGSLTKAVALKRNSFKVIKPKSWRALISRYVFREFNAKEKMILNAEELASLFHLPTLSSDVPNVEWLKAKEVAPPAISTSEVGLELGVNVFRGAVKPIKLSAEDRRQHLYVVGQTGTGKSTLINNLIVQDLNQGNGLCLIDPHGDLVERVLSLLPASRLDDVIVLDPGDSERPFGLNMLEFDPTRPKEKTFVVNELLAIFNQLFDRQSLGPMFERYMRSALTLLMEDAVHEPATLVEIPRVFTDTEYRQRKLARSTNPQVIDFWTKEALGASGDQSLANFAPYISSKFDNFIANDYLRVIIGQTKSSFDFRRAMDEGKVVLVNLAKGKVGDISSALLGMVVVGKILKAALSRVDQTETGRRDFYLYIDEFQNYTTDSIAVILSEARKYRLNLIVAHQFIAQLKDNIREAVFGNVGNLVVFRVGAGDAEILVKHFRPSFNEHNLLNAENLNAYAKILVRGEPTVPFNLKIKRLEGGSPALAEGIKELSRLRYGRDRNEVEAAIVARLKK